MGRTMTTYRATKMPKFALIRSGKSKTTAMSSGVDLSK